MVLYADESGSEDYFVVYGMLFNSSESDEQVYRTIKKRVYFLKLTNKSKQRMMNEFKSSLLNRKYPKVVNIIVDEIDDSNSEIVASFYKVNTSEIKIEAVMQCASLKPE